MIRAFTLILVATVALAVNATEKSNQLSLSETYKQSCEIVAKINKEDWESLEIIPDIWRSIETLKIHLENEKFEGIGAYRKTTENGNLGDLTHHFAFGGRKTPHELLISYTKTDESYALKGIWIHGW